MCLSSQPENIATHPTTAPSADLTVRSATPTAEAGARRADECDERAIPHRPLRRPPRKRGPERGLPPQPDRLKLAATYLDIQQQLWPDLVKRGVLPAPADAVLADMADDLRRRHVNRVLDDTARATLARPAATAVTASLYAAYIRYSCENSNPRSLDDQLRQILHRARDLKVFIPWSLVFADASVSGADASREGYNALKHVLDGAVNVAGVMIDEFSRAGRDTLEWFRLAAWAKRHNRNVRGATDDFDLNSPAGQMMLHVYAMFSEFFLTQLRDKVLRGMKGAAGRQTSVGRPPLGYGLAPKLDGGGRPAPGADGAPLREKRVHPTTMAHVERARRMLLDEGVSVGDVVREFNGLRVDGSDAWTDCSVRRTLANPIYFGFDVFNRTRNEWDPETCKRKTIVNPRSAWQVQAVPHLRVWDRRTYLAMRRKLRGRPGRRSRFAGNGRPSRNERRPRRMLSGLLGCPCGQELKEVRGGVHAAYGCYHGYYGSHGCTMNTAKAARIIEEALLDFVREHVLIPQAVERLAAQARRRAEREAALPPADVAPLEAEAADLAVRRKRLIDLVAGDAGAEMEPVRREIVNIGKRLRSLEDALRQARRRASGPVPALTAADVRRELDDLRGLLSQDGASAAHALRAITGPIAVTQERYGDHERYGGTKGGRWMLTFTPRLAPALAGSLEGRPRPADFRSRLDAAAAAEVEEARPVTVPVDRRRSVHERLAPRVKPYIGRVNPATQKPYTRSEVAADLACSVDVIHLAWRLVTKGYARNSPAA